VTLMPDVEIVTSDRTEMKSNAITVACSVAKRFAPGHLADKETVDNNNSNNRYFILIIMITRVTTTLEIEFSSFAHTYYNNTWF